VRGGAAAFVLASILVSAAFAGKPGPGTSTGTARVFFPNPVASLQDESLTDQKDADYAAANKVRAAFQDRGILP
jgi:hypothetical protein